ncbi:MAG TPA: tol-pal system protein YbgF [Alphaproteobacteria bacterium]|nr:tol-pal system protein YbgF [Alphaproteobacteria bacterium]HNS43654.1 tol-pal system protein YbgF [Alphaproteobacteria bacterium]
MSKNIVSSLSITTVRAALAACIVMGSMMTSPLANNIARADDTTSRLNRLERDVETLNRAVYKGEAPPAPASYEASGSNEYQASVETRLSAIENQIRDLTGKVEQQSYEADQLKTRLDRALADIDLRLNSGAQPTAANGNQTGTLQASDMGGPVTTQIVTQTPDAMHGMDVTNDSTTGNVQVMDMPMVDMNAPAPSDSPTQQNLGTLTEAPGGASIPPQAGSDPAGQYEMAFSMMKSGNYAASRNGFEDFLKKYPGHPLAGNAMYWLGEDYYAEGTFDKAVRVFAESYKKYPKGPKGPDSLLKMGMSLGKLGKNDQACVTFIQLKKEYGVGQDAILKRAAEESAKLACGN